MFFVRLMCLGSIELGAVGAASVDPCTEIGDEGGLLRIVGRRGSWHLAIAPRGRSHARENLDDVGIGRVADDEDLPWRLDSWNVPGGELFIGEIQPEFAVGRESRGHLRLLGKVIDRGLDVEVVLQHVRSFR